MEVLSGFATTVRGERLIFSIMGDHYGASGRDAAAIVDSLCVAMVEELGAAPQSPVKSPERQ